MIHWYHTAIDLANAGASTRIRYCQFQFMGHGIVVEAWPYSAALDINNCRFGFGDIGIAANSTVLGKTGVKVRNSLLHRLASAGVETFSPELNSEVLVENCTFDQGTKGVYAYSAQTTIRNCIFANTAYGIYRQYANAVKAENHNCFYQSTTNFPPYPTQQDPKFDPGSPPAPNIGERYYLNQSVSPCINAGDPMVECYQTTARYLGLDYAVVDMGYHYPVRGQLRIAPNFFFEWENGEAFYPIMATNMPYPLENGTEQFYSETIPAYLDVLSKHGVNMMRHYPFAQSWYLQDWEGAPFLDNGVATYDKYFDALDAKGFKYMLATYDYVTMQYEQNDPYPDYYSVYYKVNQHGGTVSEATPGGFFQHDGDPDPERMARADFKQALAQFRTRGSPPWVTREGLMGWDVFSEPDYIECWYPWEGNCATSYANREEMMGDWMTEMFGDIATAEQDALGLGRRRFHWVSAGNLRRFKQWDFTTAHDQPQYLDLHGVDATTNDYIDYHLYCDDAVENPADPFTPLQFYLGIIGDLGGQYSCTLPDVIDHYRKQDSPRRGGFFSSEMGPQFMPTRSSKRLLNDVNHNYLWLGFATGSVGGPTLLFLPNPGGPRPDWDLSGVSFINVNLDPDYALNNYTDEILDSFISLSRFTSLVRWQCISDPNTGGPPYRPVRTDPSRSITIQDDSGDPQTEWVWTAASDGTITIGWIVRNFNIHQTYTYEDPYTHQRQDIPECEDPLPPIAPPTVTITGLAEIPLELAWFDDHKGCIIGNRVVSGTGGFSLQAPNTEAGGFGKSVAFLVQPVGSTPDKDFEPLPDEMIGQIVISPRDKDHCYSWHDECPEVLQQTSLTFTAKTKPPIVNPGRYKFLWYFEDSGAEPPRDGVDHIDHVFWSQTPNNGGYYKVTLDILDKDQQDKRVSGDMIWVYVAR